MKITSFLVKLNKGGVTIMIYFQVITGLLTLFFAASGFFRSLYSSKYSIDVEEASVKDDRSLWLLSFTIANRSLYPIKVSSLSFYDDNEQVNIRNFDPQQFDEQQDEVKRQAEEEKRKHEALYGLPIIPDPSQFRTSHLPSEYYFYDPVDLPHIIHGDSEQYFSYYFSHKPNKMIIRFDKKMILSFKWFVIPIFTSSISVTFDPEKTKG